MQSATVENGRLSQRQLSAHSPNERNIEWDIASAMDELKKSQARNPKRSENQLGNIPQKNKNGGLVQGRSS